MPSCRGENCRREAGRKGDIAMTVELVSAYDSDTDQVVLEGVPAGPAGEAALAPAVGLELAFDRADGRLVRAVIDIAEPGLTGTAAATAPVELAAQDVLRRLFGPDASARLLRMAAGEGGEPAACPLDPALAGALSRLARLRAARFSSPAPQSSPLWAAEAAILAVQSGLHELARRQAGEAAVGLAFAADRAPIPNVVREAALAVADLAEPDEPLAASRLRASVREQRATSPPPLASPDDRRWPGPARSANPAAPNPSADSWRHELAGSGLPAERARTPERGFPDVQWSLDLELVPQGLFLPGLSPCADLSLHAGDEPDLLIVEVPLRPGADVAALCQCRARLVEPATRRIVAHGSFTAAGCSARAVLHVPCAVTGRLSVEVVGDEHRPVASEHSRHIRGALRWADAALRAEQQPRGLAPHYTMEDWMALAARAWRQCQREWGRAGESYLAGLASVRVGASDARVSAGWLSSGCAAWSPGQPQMPEPAFLAEASRMMGESCRP